MASFSVTRSSRILVKPLHETPTSTLDVSVIDNSPFFRFSVRTLHVYRHGPAGAAGVIREALSKALVAYYPLAGRLKESSQDNNQLQVECCGEGVWFVEASADSTLAAVNYFDDNDGANPRSELLPDRAPEIEGREPLVQIQVTQFACGGFVIGLMVFHCLCDGLGGAQFLNAIGEMAQGFEHPSIKPIWKRSFFLPTPQEENIVPILTSSGHAPELPSFLVKHATIDISMHQVNQLKKQFQDSTGQTCSTFEIVAATIWRNRTLAINPKQDTEVRLVFLANCRPFVDPPLPEGYYGNCVFPITIKASGESLAKASNVDVIKLVQEGKAKLPIEFAKFVKGEHLKNNGEDPFAMPLLYTTLMISEWGRLGFNDVDFGWGPPVHVIPVHSSSVMPVCIVGWLPEPKKGVRLMTWCVEEVHRQLFVDKMMELV